VIVGHCEFVRHPTFIHELLLTAANATETIPYPKNSATQDIVLCTPYPNSRHPAPVNKNGMICSQRRDSGSYIPLFFLVRHLQNMSTKSPVAIRPAFQSERHRLPPAHAPNTLPRSPGIFIRPLICGFQLYGGACSTNGFKMLTATTITSAIA
jgi:hypothetical protein